jgi:exosome complex component RRP4
MVKMGGLVGEFGGNKMSNLEVGAEQRLVIPGESIGDCTGKNLGSGVASANNGTIATRLGYLKENNGTIHVVPINAAYMPRSGDLIVGIVEAVQSNLWFLDVNGPFNALLPMSLAPWKVEFGDARNHMDVGEAVLARVQEVDECHNLVCTMKGVGLRKIAEGHVASVSIQHLPMVKEILGDLKIASDCRIIVGDNGRVWVDGGAEGTRLAVNTLNSISKTGHIDGAKALLEATIVGGVA